MRDYLIMNDGWSEMENNQPTVLHKLNGFNSNHLFCLTSKRTSFIFQSAKTVYAEPHEFQATGTAVSFRTSLTLYCVFSAPQLQMLLRMRKITFTIFNPAWVLRKPHQLVTNCSDLAEFWGFVRRSVNLSLELCVKENFLWFRTWNISYVLSVSRLVCSWTLFDSRHVSL